MEVVAKVKSVRVTPRKIRLVANAMKNMKAQEALDKLSLLEKRGASVLIKVLESAIANAVNNAKLDSSKLVISRLEVGEGQFLKRFRASTRGRIKPYKKRSSHVTVVLTEKEENKKDLSLEIKEAEKTEKVKGEENGTKS